MFRKIRNAIPAILNAYRKKIQVRLTISMALVSLVPIILIGLVSFNLSVNTIRRLVLDYISDESKLQVSEVEDIISQFQYDISIISKLPPIQGIIRARDNNGLDPLTGLTYDEWVDSLNQVFIPVVENKDYYYQVRYINEGGMEMARVDLDEESGRGITASMLQYKGDREYFIEAMKFEEGEIYISPLDLNQEFGKVEVPYKPVIRIATPVIDASGNKRGIVIVNIFGKYIIDRLNRPVFFYKFSPSFILVNQDGYFLLNPLEPDTEFGFDLGFDITAYDRFPWLMEGLNETESVLAENPDTGQIGSVDKINYTADNPDLYWYLITVFPLESVFAEANQLREVSLLIGLASVILIIIFSVGYGNLFTTPIQKITDMTDRIAHGDLNTRIDIPNQDELGRLAASFNQMAASIDEAQKQLAGILATANEGIITLDGDMRIMVFNQAAEKILGYSFEEVVGETIDRLIPDRSKKIHKEDMAKFANWQGKSPREMGISREITGIRKDGREIPLEASISRLDVNGKLFYTVIFRDITERKQEEWELLETHNKTLAAKNQVLENFNILPQRSNRDLQDFAYIASHDLKEPLRKVQAFGDRLADKYSADIDETGQDYIRRMQASSMRMQSLIDGLLKFSRVATQALPFEPIDLNNTVHDVIADLDQLIARTGADVISGDLPEIDGDPSQMYQVMQNLIANGIKFSAKNNRPVIKISAEVKGDQCVLKVQDNGIGFDTQYLDRIFKPFQRLHTRNEYEGTGMGLAITRRIIERHNGQITAESEPDKGATFIVTLPLHQKLDVENE